MTNASAEANLHATLVGLARACRLLEMEGHGNMTLGHLSLRRPDVQVVAHAQPFHAYLFSASLDPLRPFTVVADYFVDVPRPEDEVALMTTKEEAIALAVALGQRFAVLMRNYGVTFCGMPLAHAACVRIFLEKTWFRAKKPSPATRLKRHGQIMSPIHWEHSWNYFYRKLKVRGENADGIAAPLFG